MSNESHRHTIAITGSTGKTTTREFITSILETEWKVLKTKGNRNLPLHTKETANQFSSSYQAMVLELGMGKPGAGRRHCRYIKPDISVITNIGTAHYGNLGNSIADTARNKSALITYMDPKGTLLINSDDKHSKELSTKSFPGSIITIGIEKKADYQASNVKYENKGMSFNVTLDKHTESFTIPTFGKHNVYNALFAIAIGHLLKFSVSRIRRGLQTYRTPLKRLNVHYCKNQTLVIDDTINANPQSMKAAIDVIMAIGRGKKKVAILGSMLELGAHTRAGHEEIGRYLARRGFDAIYSYGEEAQWIHKGALGAGFPQNKTSHYVDREHLHRALIDNLKPNCAIVVKGSRLTEMELTVQYLQGLTRL